MAKSVAKVRTRARFSKYFGHFLSKNLRMLPQKPSGKGLRQFPAKTKTGDDGNYDVLASSCEPDSS
ncbi:hypothetical protein [Bacteroides acidifaciens]|uniref:hypothetical protein n=1 Tax=Bacteroides acidifaciens TaxID=85831 RepID=UPI00301540B8